MKQHKKRVLLVDDEKLDRNLYKEKLIEKGLDVIAVGSLQEAENWLSQRFDAIVVDEYLGSGKSGSEFLQELKRNHRSSKLILLTGADVSDWRRKQKKPLFLQDLELVIKKLGAPEKLATLLKKDKAKRYPLGPRKPGQIDLLTKKKKRHKHR